MSLEQVDYTLDVGAVNCACGCGEEAMQIYNGIPIADINPMTHYRRYKEQERIREQVNQQMRLGSLCPDRL